MTSHLTSATDCSQLSGKQDEVRWISSLKGPISHGNWSSETRGEFVVFCREPLYDEEFISRTINVPVWLVDKAGGGNSMSMSVLSPVVATASQPQLQHAARVSTAAQPASATLQNDTVTLSAAAQMVSQGSDVDHDGDSH